MTNMRAACLHRYGGPTAVSIDQLNCDPPAARQVLVRVAAAGVNPLDAKLRSGAMQQVMHLNLPAILGAEISGGSKQWEGR